MKKLLCLLFFLLSVSVSFSYAQIKNGFYVREGFAIPVGKFTTTQRQGVWDNTFPGVSFVGYTFEFGKHFYIGDAFLNDKLRFGIDATFISYNLFFGKKLESWDDNSDINCYSFLGQKAGPIVTFNLDKKKYLDFGFRLTPTIAYYFGEYDMDIWGRRINKEVLLNYRWKFLMISLQFNIGKINFNDFNGDGQMVDVSTVNFMFGAKF
ncbi:MAG: hypothetical protein M0R21_09430 [Lentimicrobiaceae bacterium]|jgi:hypothetical protein|nr:hypothetical protein [Lentimicrobiaceae bacterium]